MTGAAVKDITLAAGERTVIEVDTGILEADHAVAMLWNSLEELIPYCAPITLD